MDKTKSKLYTAVLALLLAIFILSLAIALPIYIRGFYYSQIDRLNIVETSGYSREVIVEAFDEMMDYCTGNAEFGTGQLVWSQEGKSHFGDCKVLFQLDGRVVLWSGLGIVIAVIGFGLFAKRVPARVLGRGPLFWGPVLIAGVAGVLAAIGSRDFDAFFIRFHQLLFPGKSNWIFDPAKDEIIKILPEEVFMNFAILIAGAVILVSVILIVIDIIVGRSNKDA